MLRASKSVMRRESGCCPREFADPQIARRSSSLPCLLFIIVETAVLRSSRYAAKADHRRRMFGGAVALPSARAPKCIDLQAFVLHARSPPYFKPCDWFRGPPTLPYPLNSKLAATSVFPPAASSKRIALARSAPSPTKLAIASSVTPVGRVALLVVVVVVVETAPDGAAGGEPERTRLGCGADPGEAPRVRPDPGKPDPLASAAAFEVPGADEVEAAALLSWAAEDPTGTGLPSLSGRECDQARFLGKERRERNARVELVLFLCRSRKVVFRKERDLAVLDDEGVAAQVNAALMPLEHVEAKEQVDVPTLVKG